MLRATLAFLLFGVASAQTPYELVREEQRIVVDGAAEQWRLVWTAQPKEECEPSDGSLTCPCEGFAYGEAGPMDLVRVRDGREIDRMSIASLFGETFGAKTAVAIIPKWPPNWDADTYEAFLKDGYRESVYRRPTIRVIHFADYDHDGRATEFYLQTEALPCGKSYGVVLGISRHRPRLHAFTPVDAPTKPLYLLKRNWEALARAKRPIDVLHWQCGDHGSETEWRDTLRWTPSGLTGTSREYSCETKPPRLLRELPLGRKR